MISLAALTLAATTWYAPVETHAMLADAATAAAHGDWAAAAAEYRKLDAHGAASADVLYDLGTAELHLDRAADAARDLARARAAGAHGRDLDENLALARRRAGIAPESRWRAVVAEPRIVAAVAWLAAGIWAVALVALAVALGASRLRRALALH